MHKSNQKNKEPDKGKISELDLFLDTVLGKERTALTYVKLVVYITIAVLSVFIIVVRGLERPMWG